MPATEVYTMCHALGWLSHATEGPHLLWDCKVVAGCERRRIERTDFLLVNVLIYYYYYYYYTVPQQVRPISGMA